MNMNHCKIRVLSISDRPSLSDCIHKHLCDYCNHHGYDIQIVSHTLDSSRHISWSKVILLLDAIKAGGYDYYVWFDDDVLITRQDIPLSQFITDHQFHSQAEKSILISEDVCDSCPFNAGVMICKPGASAIMETIWNLADVLGNRHKPNWEQDALIHYWRENANNAKNEIQIIPHRTIQSFYRDYDLPETLKWRQGDFAAHITGMELHMRLAILQTIVDKVYPSVPHNLFSNV